MVPATTCNGCVQDTLTNIFLVNQPFLVLNPSMKLDWIRDNQPNELQAAKIFAAKRGMYSEQQNHCNVLYICIV